MERIEGYLSKIAQTKDAEALVMRLGHAGPWVLRRPGEDDVGLGEEFRDARVAILAWVHSRAASKEDE